MYDGISSPRDLKIVVHHEISHAVMAELLGKPIKHVQIVYRKREGEWYGNTPLDDLSSDINSLWPILYLVPNDEYKDIRDRCTIKFAGLVTERLMGVDEKEIQSGCRMDKEHIYILLDQRFHPNEWETELLNAEIRAMNVLSNPIHWSKVQNIAKGLISAINQGKEPLISNDYRCEYLFSRDEIKKYESLV